LLLNLWTNEVFGNEVLTPWKIVREVEKLRMITQFFEKVNSFEWL
jgi:hypothetical protein